MGAGKAQSNTILKVSDSARGQATFSGTPCNPVCLDSDVWSIRLLRCRRALTGSAYTPIGNIYRIIPRAYLSLGPMVAMGLHTVGVLTLYRYSCARHGVPEKIPARSVLKQPSFSRFRLRR